MNKTNPHKLPKMIVIVGIMIPIALLHFLTGSHYQGPFPLFVNGYLLDILLPMGFYLLLCLNDRLIFSSWLIKGLSVFGAAVAVEMAQRMGIPLLGRTYDSLDILMYALGVALAVVFDLILFPKVFPFWKSGLPKSHEPEETAEGMFTWRYK